MKTKQKSERTRNVSIRLTMGEWREIQAIAESQGLSGAELSRRAALGKIQELKRNRPVPELNRRAYLEIGKLQVVLEEKQDEVWGDSERELLLELLSEIKALRLCLLGQGSGVLDASTAKELMM